MTEKNAIAEIVRKLENDEFSVCQELVSTPFFCLRARWELEKKWEYTRELLKMAYYLRKCITSENKHSTNQIRNNMGHTEAKEIFARYADDEGYISASIEDIATIEVKQPEDRQEFIESLYSCIYYYEVEFKDETEKEWRFTEQD